MLYKDYLTQKKPYQEFGGTFLLERKHACLYYKPPAFLILFPTIVCAGETSSK